MFSVTLYNDGPESHEERIESTGRAQACRRPRGRNLMKRELKDEYRHVEHRVPQLVESHEERIESYAVFKGDARHFL